MTPRARPNGEAVKIMEKRKKVYKAARELHPQRFDRGIRK